ncbi:MAG: hypothetical protein GWO41_02160 [candidate division Zixibacteria bacterium]|nr:hypothetical protein [candidate division Zixibacteria bacterium]NIR63922.1 hypothetical protein [candidate division Zixibacteria bacterium]NIS15062.1 hypothetical protein [candidate division Zixibacteria bacterium]NIS45839.1 hypothetical protein [candidate division Zixibacteria bacterium]NIT51572.1 hypothetical protein [candidate division Zixibacteria bacterium]
MKKTVIMISVLFLLPSFIPQPVLADDAGSETRFSLWLGGHYNSWEDYGEKLGEFRHIYDNAYPEARFNLFNKGSNYFLNLDGHYYDNKNISGDFTAKFKNRLKVDVSYLLFRRQLQADLLNNINAREMLENGSPGGKMLTHEDLNPGFDFNYDRHRIESKVEFLIDEKNNIRVTAAHRFWNDSGHEQRVASTHCFSCHLTSQAVEVDRTVNQFNLGIEGKPGPVGVSYNFIYSKFSSNAAAPSIFYDEAKHPVNGGSAEEFDSRVIYAGEEITYATYPETEKIGNKVRFSSDIGRHRLSGSAFYHRSENDLSDLESQIIAGEYSNLVSDTYGGSLNFSALLNRTMRLLARTSISRTKADDIMIELPLWREGRPGGGQDFSFMRYSSLDRLRGEANVEMIMRLNPQTTLSVLGGYEGIRRDDYPYKDADDATNRLIGQAKVRYRDGLKYSLGFKYRLEMTSNPFTNYRGLFEAAGREEGLSPLEGNTFIFYFQREDLKYQDVTTLPTIKHDLELTGNLNLTNKVGLNANVKLRLDKNNDLDSLEVEHTFFQPSLGFNIMPTEQWVFSGGMRYQILKSRGPVTVAMFDG